MKDSHFKGRDRRSPDFGTAFVPDVARSHKPLADDWAEAFAEEFIVAATSAEAVAEVVCEEPFAEEIGGPLLPIRTIDEMDLTPSELLDWAAAAA